MITKEGSTQIVNIMTPEAGVLEQGCGHTSHIVKMHYSFNNLLYSQAKIKQTKYIVMMTKERSTQIVNFITHGAGVLMLGRGLISHYCEYVSSSTLSIYITLIAIVLREYNVAFLCHC